LSMRYINPDACFSYQHGRIKPNRKVKTPSHQPVDFSKNLLTPFSTDH
jgi:hypothetical protein